MNARISRTLRGVTRCNHHGLILVGGILVLVMAITSSVRATPSDTALVIGNGTPGPYYLTGRPLLSREIHLLDPITRAPLERTIRLSERPARVVFERPLSLGDSVLVAFEALPFAIRPPAATALRDERQLARPAAVVSPGIPHTRSDRRTTPLDLTFSGTKSFGFSVGNNRQSSMQQGLHLTLDGKLTESLSINATLSDRLSDRLSSGATASRIQELEDFFVELRSPKFRTRLGDIQWQQAADGRNRTRQLAGIQLEVKPGNHRIEATAGELAGQAKQTEFFAQPGLQGPYNLAPARGRIQPQSERVYLDGRLLTAGPNQDYEIDYYTGEITFTPQVELTERSRIQVEYEELENLYQRRGAALDWSVQGQQYENEVRFLWEGDDADRGVGFAITPETRERLEQSSKPETWVPAEEYVGPGNGEYIKHEHDDREYFEYVGPENGEYNVRFSYVGAGNGSYAFLGGGAYGHVGDSLGDYTPRIKFVAPSQRSRILNRFRAEQLPLGSMSLTGLAVSHTPNTFQSSSEQTNWSHDLRWSSRPQLNGSDSTRIAVDAGWRRIRETSHSHQELNLFDITRKWYFPTGDRYRLTGADLLESQAVLPFSSWARARGEVGSLSGGVTGHRHAQEISLTPFSLLEWHVGRTHSTITLLDNERRERTRLELKQIVHLGIWKLTTVAERERHKETALANQFDVVRWQLARGAWKLQHAVEWLYDSQRSRLLTRGYRLSASGDLRLPVIGLAGDFTAARLSRREMQTGRLDLRYFGNGKVSWAYRPWDLRSTARYTLNQAGTRQWQENYIPVADGFGDYRLEDSLFVPDQQGNYRRVVGTGGALETAAVGRKHFTMTKSYASKSDGHSQWLNDILVDIRHDRNERLDYRQLSIANWLIPWGDMRARDSRSTANYVSRSTSATIEHRFMQSQVTWYLRGRLAQQRDQYGSLAPARRTNQEISARQVAPRRRWENIEFGVRLRERSSNATVGSSAIDLQAHSAWLSAGYSLSSRSTLSLTPSAEFLTDRSTDDKATVYGFTPTLTWHSPGKQRHISTRARVTYEYVDALGRRDYIPGFNTIHGIGHNLRAHVDGRLKITSSVSATLQSHVRMRRHRAPEIMFNVSAVSRF